MNNCFVYIKILSVRLFNVHRFNSLCHVVCMCDHMCIYMISVCVFAHRSAVWSWYVMKHMSVCLCTCKLKMCACVSPGCLEEACSRVSRQHRGCRPPAADQTAAGRLFPAVFQHGGEFCMTPCTPHTDSEGLNLCARSCVMIQKGLMSTYTPKYYICFLIVALVRHFWSPDRLLFPKFHQERSESAKIDANETYTYMYIAVLLWATR